MGFDVEQLKQGVLNNQRVLLGRALTLVESQLPAHRQLAQQLLAELAPHAGGSQRIGFTGPPGAGKSTLIEALGLIWTERQEKVGVLAIDPSSESSGGSILGDKTRMERLSQSPLAFLRPSPNSGNLGGVARRTRECIAVLEAAGYTRIVVETVGVGQSEISVSHLVDTVLLVALPGAGDEVQGIKRGLMETADLVFVNKADGDRAALARLSANQMSLALRLLSARTPGWAAEVLMGSAQEGFGLLELLEALERHQHFGLPALGSSRGAQALHWFHREVEDVLLARFYGQSEVQSHLEAIQNQVRSGKLTPEAAAAALLNVRQS